MPGDEIGRTDSAAYTPPTGMKSLEWKLMHNGERGVGYFEPEWAEVRVVMRERDELRRCLDRAAFIAEHLFQMIDPQAWRDSGGDDGQGHYEGDYHAAQMREEIKSWTK